MRLHFSRPSRRGAAWTAVAGGTAVAVVATALATGVPSTSSAAGPAVRITSADEQSAAGENSPMADAVSGAIGPAPTPPAQRRPDATPGRWTPADPAKEKAWHFAPPKLVFKRGTPPPREPGERGVVTVDAVPATFSISYGRGFPAAAQAAFAYAVARWASYLDTDPSKPISVQATWSGSLGATQLGEATVPLIGTDVPADPHGTTFYPQALFDHLSPTLADSSDVDIDIAFSSTAPWHFGTDAAPASGQADFVTTAMHEIGHGLGFTGGMSVDAFGRGQKHNPTIPVIFDRFVQTVSGTGSTSVLAFADNSTTLADVLRGAGSDLYFRGPATGSTPGARLYTPNPWNGSGYSHLDEAIYPAGSGNALLTPTLLTGEAEHDPGPLVRAMLTDMGWTPAVADTTAPDTSITTGPVEGSTITAPTAAFSFTSTEEPSTFQCRTDGLAWDNCSSPFTTGTLTDGTHTVAVRAVDAAGNIDASPASRTFTVDALPAGTLSFSAGAYTVSEGDSAPITVTRTGGADGAVSATLTTTDGTANSDDYTPTTETITFAAGEDGSKTVIIATTADTAVEAEETVTLSLTNLTGGAGSGLTGATLSITNDSATAPGTLSFGSPSYSVEEGDAASITVTRTGGTDGAVSATFTTANGTANSGDYTATSTTVTFTAGEDGSKTVPVLTTEDTAVETDETVALSLGSPTGGAALGRPVATLTINDDDAASATPVVRIVANDGAAAEAATAGRTGQFTVTRTGGTTSALAVSIGVAGTASAGSDYTALGSTVIIPAGASTATLTVVPINDALDEADETVIVTITDTAAYDVGSPRSATLTIADDDPARTVCTIDRRNARAPQTITGTAGKDVICGSRYADTIRGLGGNDVIFGNRGADSILGGNGDDQLRGGAGNDKLYGGAGADSLDGGAGRDACAAGPGAGPRTMNCP